MQELKNIRRRRGLTQADLAVGTGVSEFTISEIEAGKRMNPRPSTLRKLAAGLGVTVADLYGEPFDSPKATTGPPSREWATSALEGEFNDWLNLGDPAGILAVQLELSEAVGAATDEVERARLRSRRDRAIDALMQNFGPLKMKKRWDEPREEVAEGDERRQAG